MTQNLFVNRFCMKSMNTMRYKNGDIFKLCLNLSI